MARLAVHLHPETRDLLGVWVKDADQAPVAAYRVKGYHQQAGTDVMASKVPESRGGTGWDEWVDYLSERTPVDIWWESMDRKASATGKPETALAALSRLLVEHPPRRASRS